MARPGEEIAVGRRPRLKGSYSQYAGGMLVEILAICFFMILAFSIGYLVLAIYR